MNHLNLKSRHSMNKLRLNGYIVFCLMYLTFTAFSSSVPEEILLYQGIGAEKECVKDAEKWLKAYTDLPIRLVDVAAINGEISKEDKPLLLVFPGGSAYRMLLAFMLDYRE